MMMKIENHPSYIYAKALVEDKVKAPELYIELNSKEYVVSPKYVKKQAQIFLDICDGLDDKYTINLNRVVKIDKLSKLLVMAKGIKAGEKIYNALAGYQWLLIIASLCVVHRSDLNKRRYTTIILEICRKNGKTFIVAFLILILFYLEPKYSRFFSVAPDGSLAREIKEALEPLITANIDIFEGDDGESEFKILRDAIRHKTTGTKYTPLNYSTNRMDGKEPNVFIADEVGALPSPYPIEAMRSGQLLIKNRLGFIISTKYPTVDNPFEDEVDNAKKILDGLIQDETVFALLYEPNDAKNWTTDDDILLQSNPLAIEVSTVYEDLLKKRRDAINRESLRENFLTKHCNIIYQGEGTESYIDVSEVQKCRVAKIDWTGREVYVGVDLAMSNDNCAVVFVAEKDGKILIEPMCFIPEGRIEEKSSVEKLDYREFIRNKQCIACGDKTIDYEVIEDYVFEIEKKFGVTIIGIGYDRFNALSSAQKWDKEYTTVQIRQHSDTLHPPTKLLYEKFMNGQVEYVKNKLFEVNFQNAKCTYDTNMNRYVTKKKSKGKVDMVMATINAVFLLQQDCFLNEDDFDVQIL